MTQGRPFNSEVFALWRQLTGRLTSNHALVFWGRLALWGAAFVTAFMGQMQLTIVSRGSSFLRHLPVVGDHIQETSLGRGVVYMAVATVFIIAATPFTDEGALDLYSVDSLTDFYLGCGVPLRQHRR